MQRIAMLSFHTCPAAFKEEQEIGGMNTYVWELSHALASPDLLIDIFTRRHDMIQPEVINLTQHVRLIHLPAGPLTSLTVTNTISHINEYAEQLAQFILDAQLTYTFFHCHYYLSGLIASQFNQITQRSIPVIMSFHTLSLAKNKIAIHQNELESTYRIDAEKYLMRYAKQIIANCVLDQMHLHTLYQVPLEKISIISPGINTALFQQKKQSPELSKKVSQLLFVGRTQPIKGLDNLLQALKILNKLRPERYTLMVIGSDIDSIQQLTNRMEISSAIQLIPQCNPQQLAHYYHTADLFILPSYHESYGMVALEAIACGTPVIVTENCGIADMIQAYNKHWVIPNNTPSLLAKTILNFTNNPVLLKTSINVTQFSWFNVAKKVKQLYVTCLDSSSDGD